MDHLTQREEQLLAKAVDAHARPHAFRVKGVKTATDLSVDDATKKRGRVTATDDNLCPAKWGCPICGFYNDDKDGSCVMCNCADESHYPSTASQPEPSSPAPTTGFDALAARLGAARKTASVPALAKRFKGESSSWP